MKFSLISYPKYDILKVISLPDHDNVFILTEVDQTIIAVDSVNQHYMTLTREDLSIRCKQIDYILYSANILILHIMKTQIRCEIQMYVQNSNSKILYNTRFNLLNLTIWVVLENQRAWLYSISYEQTITIDCKNCEEYRMKIVRMG